MTCRPCEWGSLQRSPELSQATFFVLLSLAEGPRHGYAILRTVEELSSRRVALSTGTLYGAIKRLLGLGWIRPADDPLPQRSLRERQAYELSGEGRAILAVEVKRMESLVRLSRGRLAVARR